MAYSAADEAAIRARHADLVMRLNAQVERVILLGQRARSARARRFLLNGVARRIRMLRHCLTRVFEKFPPDRRTKVEQEDLWDVTVCLQAFVMHVAGILDNWAWALVEEQGVGTAIRREAIGLFKPTTQRHLARPVVEYLNSQPILRWNADYQKNYRDALAHRIPLYIPPFELTDVEAQRHQEIDAEIGRRVRAHEFDNLEALYSEQDALGRPSFRFVHSFGEHDSDPPMLLHPQMLADAATIADICELLVREFPPEPRVGGEEPPA